MKSVFVIMYFFMFNLLADGVNIDVEHYKLDNGLNVYLSQDKNSPVTAVVLYYKVGSVNEEKGKTGFAHLFEHMMFQGTKNIDKAEHFKLIQKFGGKANAYTTREYTVYYDVVPSNQVNLALWLEADRMENLSVNFINFKNQLEVVKEEMRMRYLNTPYGELLKTIDNISHDTWNYKHSVIGSMKDLDSSGVKYAKTFFKKYYNPNNAILIVSGDIDKVGVKEKIKEYFGKIKNNNENYENKILQGEKTDKKAILNDNLANMPALALAYKAPCKSNLKEYLAMKMFETVLFNNDSSRLYRSLIKDKELAVSVYGGIGDLKRDNLFYIFSMTKKGTTQKVKELVLEEIEKIKKEGITDDELKKAKLSFKTEFVFNLDSNLSKALLLGEYVLLFGNTDKIKNIFDVIENITKDDVKNIANKYMNDKNLFEVDVKSAK